MTAASLTRGVGRWFGKGELYRSVAIGKGSMISVYKIESSYVTIRKHRGGGGGAPAPGAPMVPTPMNLIMTYDSIVAPSINTSYNFNINTYKRTLAIVDA